MGVHYTQLLFIESRRALYCLTGAKSNPPDYAFRRPDGGDQPASPAQRTQLPSVCEPCCRRTRGAGRGPRSGSGYNGGLCTKCFHPALITFFNEVVASLSRRLHLASGLVHVYHTVPIRSTYLHLRYQSSELGLPGDAGVHPSNYSSFIPAHGDVCFLF